MAKTKNNQTRAGVIWGTGLDTIWNGAVQAASSIKTEFNKKLDSENLAPVQPKKKPLCGAQKKRLKKAKAEAKTSSIKHHNSTNKFLNLPREIRQQILYDSYNHNTAKLKRCMIEEFPPCQRFIEICPESHSSVLYWARRTRRVDYPEVLMKKMDCKPCIRDYLRLLVNGQQDVANWTGVLKRIHSSLLDEVDFVGERCIKEYWQYFEDEGLE